MGQPLSDPPASSYSDVVRFDQPIAYWRFTDDFVAALLASADTGPGLVATGFNTVSGTADGAIAGDNPGPYAGLTTTNTQSMHVFPVTDAGDPPDLQGATEATIEVWILPDRVPNADTVFLSHNNNSTLIAQYSVAFNAAGTVSGGLRDSGGTTHTATGGSLVLGAWNHVCLVADGASLTLYINGTAVASTSWSAVVASAVISTFLLGGASAAGGSWSYDEVAIYRTALSATRVAAHYVAGTARGFPRSQMAGQRIGGLLDSVQSRAPRQLQAGTRPLAGQWTGNGQNTLDALREAENAEAVDSVLFVASDGTVTFLDGGHRSSSPYNTVQATFGDAGGSELDFMDIQLDYSDSFIANEWNVTRDGGTVQTASDTTSIGRYYKRPQSLTDLKLRDDADALDVAQDMLSKYKDPLVRVLSITPKTMNTTVLDAVFQLDLGDRVRVLVTPPGGGARIDQTLFVQSITVDATPQAVFPTVTLGVSPV